MSTDSNDVHEHRYETPTSWYAIIREASDRLREVDPNYRINQIKEKFGGLRYYYSSSEGLSEARRQRMQEIVDEAEAAIDELENVARQNRELDKVNAQVWASEGGSL